MNLLEDTVMSEVIESKESKELQEAQEAPESPESPEASDIELSCVVITIDICKELNLFMIAKYIEISEHQIVGIKFKTRNKLIVRGEIGRASCRERVLRLV